MTLIELTDKHCWHSWYAWHPVWIGRKFIWLQPVYRIWNEDGGSYVCDSSGYAGNYGGWEYNLEEQQCNQ